MHWTRRIFIFLGVFFSLVISGCFGSSSSLSIDWSTVDIEITDHYNIPIGTYTIPFSIDDIIELADDYDVVVTWSITRGDQQPVSFTDNQFTVEAGVVYTASITVTIENNLYSYHKEVTLEAVAETMTITWDYHFEAGTQSEITTHPLNTAINPLTAPNQSGYLFVGWFASLSDTIPFDFTSIIPSSTTFYAKWEILVEASLHTDYFTYVDAVNGSFIHDGHPFQHMTLQATFLYDNNDLPEEIDEYGMIYSESASLTWGTEAVKVVESPDPWLDHLGYVNLETPSLPLDDLTTYYARPYVRYDHVVYYGEVVSYDTDILVPSGQTKGLLSHVSGGAYYYDYGSTQYNSSVFIELDSGYEAELNGHSIANFERISKQGAIHLVTIDSLDSARYLHVLSMTHRTNPATLLYQGAMVSSTYVNEIEHFTIRATYKGQYIKNTSLAYDFDHAGVLYSTSHPFLTRDQVDVTKLTSTQVNDEGVFTSDDAYIIPSGAEQLYVRGYVIEDDCISYSDHVEVFEKGIESWEKVDNYVWNTTNLQPSASYEIFTSPSAITRVTTFSPNKSSEDITGNLNISGPGTKYVTTPSSNYLSIHEMIFSHDPLVITGVADGLSYNHPVTIEYVDWNVNAYLQIGEDEINFASGVTISESGFYTLSLYHISGDVTISFTIA